MQQDLGVPTSMLPSTNKNISSLQPMTIKVTEDCTHLIWLGIAAISVGAYMMKKKD
jgi:hypothetical protein